MKHFFSLRLKLIIYTLFFIIASMVTIGMLSNNYLQNYFHKDAKIRLHEAFFNLSLQLKSVEHDLTESLHFISENEAMIASLNLIKNYEDIHHYKRALFDEEKKRIIDILLHESKYSLNDTIAVYNASYQLVAYIHKNGDTYDTGYVSYNNGNPIYYVKSYNEAAYHTIPKPENIKTTLHLASARNDRPDYHGNVIYESYNNELRLRSSHSIFRNLSSNKKDDFIGFLETNKKISRQDINRLVAKEDLSLSYDFNFNGLTVTHLNHEHYIDTHTYENAPLLFSEYTADALALGDATHILFSGVRIPLEKKSLLVTAYINKDELQAALIQSRKTLIITIVLIAIATLIISFITLNKMLSLPLKRLLNGIEIISKGDYSHQIDVTSNDEFGHISLEFNKMAQTIAAREQELDKLAHFDALTQMPNRVMFQKHSDAAINRAKRRNSKLAIFFLDLDEFKIINDTLGHNVGDQLLIEVSKNLSKIMRNSDFLARIGGDEFNILVEDLDSAVAAEEIAQKIIAQMKKPLMVNGKKMHITSSVGISIYPNDGQESVTLLKNADLAMYQAKADGRNKYHFFSQELEVSLNRRTAILKELKQALNNQEFQLYYQPKFSLKDGTIYAAEALLRWENKELGFVTPDQFIPLAEESGEIIRIGAWVIERACHDFARWQKNNLGITQVSVNVSNIQFDNENILEILQSNIKSAGISAASLEVEMTESFIHKNSNKALATLHRIRDIGIELAIDDFGTGYSSMSYLKRLPLNRIKIDKSFIEHIPHDSDDVEITKIIVALAKVMELSITAEGIETVEQMRFLQELECDEGQGYLCSRPLPHDAFMAFVRNNNDWVTRLH